MSGEVEPAVEAALAIFGDEYPLKPLAERFGKSMSDALAQYGTRWFWRRANDLWKSAQVRLSTSDRTPTNPRVQAATDITEHGAAEERRDLREAYENLAARSMTEEERDHDYEGYVQILRALKSGDIAVLRAMRDDAIDSEHAVHSGLSKFIPLLILNRLVDSTFTNVMDRVDRLEAKELVTVRINSKLSRFKSRIRQPGEWSVEDLKHDQEFEFGVSLKPRGVVFLEHIADLDPRKEAAAN